MPAGVTPFQEVFRLPDGEYVALAVGGVAPDGSSVFRLSILRSADGVVWRVDQGDLPGDPTGFVAAGDRLFASAQPAITTATATRPPNVSSTGSPDDSAGNPIWQSADAGRTWQTVKDGSGRIVRGDLALLGDAVMVLQYGSDNLIRLAWLGKPGAGTAADRTVPATQAIGSSAAHTSPPWDADPCSGEADPVPSAGVIGGFSGWHEAESTWAGPDVLCARVSDSNFGRIGSDVAVLAACQGSDLLHVSLYDSESAPGSSDSIVATFDVQCPIASTKPSVAYLLQGVPAGHQGHQFGLQVTGLTHGNYGFLIETRDETSGPPSP
jgi:hypothetical protein